MVKKLISIVVVLAVIAVIVMTVIGSGDYSSMVQWPWMNEATSVQKPAVVNVPTLIEEAGEAADSVAKEPSPKIVMEKPVEGGL